MVRPNGSDSKLTASVKGILVLVVVMMVGFLCGVRISGSQPKGIDHTMMMTPTTTTTTTTTTALTHSAGNNKMDELWAEENSAEVKRWREELSKKALGDNEKELKELMRKPFAPTPLVPCQYTILDFGSSVGATLRKFIDAGLPEIRNKHTTFDLESGSIQYYDTIGTRDLWFLPRYMRDHFPPNKGPEDYCFYGVEGNPYFTPMLQTLALTVNGMRPRPVRKVRFLTEHVGTNHDGPTTLHLDTINHDHNYWGSSLFSTHSDVVKSNNTAQVMGITLTTLLRETTLSNGHVIINMDIEGGEFLALEEAVSSNVFCDLVKTKNVTVDLLVEFHSDKNIGTDQPRIKWEASQGESKIKQCGVGYTEGDGR